MAQRKWNAGFTESIEQRCLAVQFGRCAICRAPDTSCADHTEVAGVKVPRGMLCNWCNLALGFYEGYQRPAGLRLDAYEKYLDAPPASVIK